MSAAFDLDEPRVPPQKCVLCSRPIRLVPFVVGNRTAEERTRTIACDDTNAVIEPDPRGTASVVDIHGRLQFGRVVERWRDGLVSGLVPHERTCSARNTKHETLQRALAHGEPQRKRCAGCGAMMVMVKTKQGKWMPCDDAKERIIPGQAGSRTVVTESGLTLKGEPCDARAPGGVTGLRPHWASCPSGLQFRRE